jgi:CDP-diacylglycerol---glycerol-3-phosphate 3-phosphatidyltransferase
MIKKEYINIANILTFSRIICGILFLSLFLYVRNENPEPLVSLVIESISFLIFVIAIITDGLDGYYARKINQVTDFGKHFDPLSDSIFFIIIFFTFWIINLMPLYFFLMIFFRETFMHFYLRPYVRKKGSILPASIFGKIKTIFQSIFSLIILFGLILRNFLLIIKIDYPVFMEIIIIVSYVFFAVIVFLSLVSLLLYIIDIRKNLS